MEKLIKEIEERIEFTENLAKENKNTALVYEDVGMKKVLQIVKRSEKRFEALKKPVMAN